MAVFSKPTKNVSEISDKLSAIHVIDKSVCCCGNEDWFGIGFFNPMKLSFDRLFALSKVNTSDLLKLGNPWTAESFLIYYMQLLNIDVVSDINSIFGCLVKPTYRVNPSEP
jgi:hypothetical protein